MPVITTWAVPGQSVWLRDNQTGEQLQVGVFDSAQPGTENKMQPIRSAFDGFASGLLRAYAREGSGFLVIDEIGYLETESTAYCQALWELMDSRPIAATVRKQEIPFLRQLLEREDVFVVDLDDPFGPLGCVIMASGEGKRFGGNKLMAPFHGKPMIQWTLEATEGIFAQRVVVTRHEVVALLCKNLGIPAVLHSEPFRSDTVRLGMTAMDANLTGCFFCPGDQPLLKWDTVAALALCAKNSPLSIWRTAHENTPGSPVCFPAEFFDSLCHLPQGQGGNAIIRQHPEQVSYLDVPDGRELLDVDTPDVLEYLESMPFSREKSY